MDTTSYGPASIASVQFKSHSADKHSIIHIHVYTYPTPMNCCEDGVLKKIVVRGANGC